LNNRNLPWKEKSAVILIIIGYFLEFVAVNHWFRAKRLSLPKVVRTVLCYGKLRVNKTIEVAKNECGAAGSSETEFKFRKSKNLFARSERI